MIITYKQLEGLNPCRDQFRIYKKHFPDNLEVTLDGLLKAAELGLSLDWFANEFLPGAACAAYYTATEPVWDAYQKAVVPILWDILKEVA